MIIRNKNIFNIFQISFFYKLFFKNYLFNYFKCSYDYFFLIHNNRDYKLISSNVLYILKLAKYNAHIYIEYTKKYANIPTFIFSSVNLVISTYFFKNKNFLANFVFFLKKNNKLLLVFKPTLFLIKCSVKFNLIFFDLNLFFKTNKELIYFFNFFYLIKKNYIFM